MTDPVQFVQVKDPKGNPTPLYEMGQTGSVGWAGYLVTAQVTLPDSIGITDSLNGSYNGAYIFCVSRPSVLDSDPAGFVQLLNIYIKNSISANRALFWLQSATAPYFGAFANYGFQFGPSFSGWVVNTNLNAWMGANLSFNVNASLVITADETNAQLVLSYPSSTNPLINLQTQQQATTVVTANDVTMQLPLTGTSTGCAIFNATLATNTLFAPPPQGLLQGLHYAYNANGADQSLFYPVFASSMPSSLQAQLCIDPSDPVNSQIATAALASGCLRSGIVLQEGPQLASGYALQQGNAVTLTPVGANAADVTPPPQAGGFAFASASPMAAGAGTWTVYLAPAGTYGVSAATVGAGKPLSLLGGLFGSEGIGFSSHAPGADNSLLCFVPSQPAYAPVFPYQPASLQQSGSGNLSPRLSAKYQTAWATLLNSGTAKTLYQAQPEGSPLFGVGTGNGGTKAARAKSPKTSKPAKPALASASPPILQSMPPFLGFTGSSVAPFPLIPYGLTQTNAQTSQTLKDYESQIIVPTRKQIISSQAVRARQARNLARKKVAMLGASAVTAQYSTSPQGFLIASDSQSGAYQNVLLGQSGDGAGGYLPFSFAQPVSEPLESALQTNQLFLSAVDPTNLSSFNNTAKIAGWTFSAPVGQGVTPTSYANVMILKFCSGLLLDRVKNPNLWTSPEDFSLAPGTSASAASIAYAGLAQWLQAYIEDAIAKSESKLPSAHYYKNFASLAQDPGWKGVIVLNASLSFKDLPPEIAGLAAGIDFSQFTAHHFGFTVSRVLADPTAAQPLYMDGESSFFGLIDYELPSYAQNLANGVDPNVPVAVAVNGDFQFTVLLLQALFVNSRLADFQSRVQLSVASLFSSAVTSAVSNAVPGISNGSLMPANAIVLTGSYVAQSGNGSNAGSYVFQQDQTTVFPLNSNALQAVAFNHVQFNTLSSDSTTTASRFLVWGAFDFVSLLANDGSDFDVLSFGSAPGTPKLQLGAGLAFSNYSITLSSPNATPNVQSFAVTTSNISYDLTSSSLRGGSLFGNFGLQMKNFITAGPGETPANYGFLPVSSSLNLSMLDDPWQGVVYRVTMGGPGALASTAGFESDLLLAWSAKATANSKQNAVFIGLSLPGASPGAKLFSLQGVFKVSVGSISLIRQLVSGSTKYGYCLKLDDIGIKILGIAKLPPDATIQFFLFGDPNNTGSLGWYAAWAAQNSNSQTLTRLPPPPAHRLSGPGGAS
ncbi:MAG: hypothetical protein WC722_07510 [Rhodospirillales bacterium]|jgi:hypothetical protein